MTEFTYEVIGLDGNKHPYKVSETFSSMNILSAMEEAPRRMFEQLTRGRAEYGKPGQGGCKGPYKILSVRVWEASEAGEQAVRGQLAVADINPRSRMH